MVIKPNVISNIMDGLKILQMKWGAEATST
jgi:hypothetical protein